MVVRHQSDIVVLDISGNDASQQKLTWRLLVMTSDVSGVIPGKDRLLTADASVPLGPPALKLIPKQKLFSNGELKWLLWNAVAMESGCKEQRQRRQCDFSKRVQMLVPNLVAPSICSEASVSPTRIPEAPQWKCRPTGFGWNFFCVVENVRRWKFHVCANEDGILSYPRPQSGMIWGLFIWISCVSETKTGWVTLGILFRWCFFSSVSLLKVCEFGQWCHFYDVSEFCHRLSQRCLNGSLCMEVINTQTRWLLRKPEGTRCVFIAQ